MVNQTAGRPKSQVIPGPALATFVVLMGGLLWAYWPALDTMWRRWGSDPQYSHGYLVPIFAGILLWMRRATLPGFDSRRRAWGAVMLAIALAIRLGGGFFYFEFLDHSSLVLAICGLVLMCFGWGIFRWALPAVLFLMLMIPMPHTIEIFARKPLRRFGTVASSYLLQSLGFNAFPRGNTIELDNSEVGVAEACSGLRMLMIFVALAVAIALVSRRPMWERVLIVLSSVPIALISNILRIVITAILHEKVGGEIGDKFGHDFAGWMMMPTGLILLGIESWILANLLIVEHDKPMTAQLGYAGGATAPSRGPNQPGSGGRRK